MLGGAPRRWRRGSITAAAGLALILTIDVVAAQTIAPGDLDPTFSDDGMVTTDVRGDEPPDRSDVASAVGIDSKGRIVVAGGSLDDLVSEGGTNDFAIARYLADGSLDTSFARDGTRTIKLSEGADFVTDLAIDGQDRIVVAGYASVGRLTNFDFAVARLLESGALDPGFGKGGKVRTNFGSTSDRGHAVGLVGQGRIVVVGETRSDEPNDFNDFAVARYEPDGDLDPTFDGDGRVTTDIDEADIANAVTIDRHDRIIAAGQSFNQVTFMDIVVARYQVNGNLDTSFAGDGVATADIENSGEIASDVALAAGGRIVVTGETTAGDAPNNFSLARFGPDGHLDATFGQSGTVVTDVRETDNRAFGIDIDGDGRIVVAGGCGEPDDQFGSRDFCVARYEVGGSLDAAFGRGGIVVTAFSPDDDAAFDVVADTADRVVTAGFSDEFNLDFAVARYLGESG
jgi:uncharacterized delta-60 repeat protein